MTELPFSIYQRPHSPVETVPWVLYPDGKTRRASPEEAALWDAYAEARRLIEAAEQKRGKR